MTRKRVRTAALGALIVALGAWYGATRWLDGGPAPAAAAPPGLPTLLPELPPAAADQLDAALRQAEQQWVAAVWPRDPFFRFADPGAGEETRAGPADPRPTARFALSAVLSGSPPLALINGRVVAVGDRLADGSIVVAIDADSVTLEGSQGSWTLRLRD